LQPGHGLGQSDVRFASTASANNAAAFGRQAVASASGAVALGAGSVANVANTVSVGAAGAERREDRLIRARGSRILNSEILGK
jgi:autotransporter adhesin